MMSAHFAKGDDVEQRDHQFTGADAPTLLYGADSTTHIVAVEPGGPSDMLIYRRQPDGSTTSESVPWRPWIVTRPVSPFTKRRGVELKHLHGDLPLNTVVSFETRNAFRDATEHLDNDDLGVLSIRNQTTQFLLGSGRTQFKDMSFELLRRMQFDIETLGLEPQLPDAEVIMIAIRQDDVETVLIQESSEKDLLERFVETMQRLDPDVIEGHNIYLFDLPFLVERANRAGVPLAIGRDGSTPIVSSFRSNFRVGPISLPYTSIHVRGRHVIDTYQQIQRWDVQGRLSSYGLKSIMRELKLERSDRVHVRGEDIGDLWRAGERSRDRLARYALDDVKDVDRLSRITLPREFYQSQIVPMSLETSATSGMGTKIDLLMTRAYLQREHSLPIPMPSRGFAGAYLELIHTGIFGPIVKADVESLYPSIMLENGITSRNDVLGAFPLLLSDLTDRRIAAKRNAEQAQDDEYALWDGLQGTFKILINSFFGYLGFGRGRFNDFDSAERITLEGQRLIQIVVQSLRKEGAEPIEVDTDGVFFTPPATVTTLKEEEALVARVSEALPGRIRLAHDGRYQRMMSLKLKNYALLDYTGTMTMKGSALRSRRMEPILREFLRDAAQDFMRDDRDAARDRYFTLAQRFQERDVPIESISQWSMLRQSTVSSQRRLVDLLNANKGRWRYGERVSLYERADGTLGFSEDYASDENTGILLRHLKDCASRFEPLFEDSEAFEAFFPTIQPTTHLDIARDRKPTRQLGLFG